MSLVPDITAGTGSESDETPVGGGPVGLSQSEGTHEMAVSVDGVLFRGPSHLGVGRPSIYTTSGRRYGRNPRPNRHPGHFPTRRFHRPLSFRHARHNLWGCSARNFRVASPSPWLSPRFVRCVRMRWPKARKNRAYL